MNLLVVTRKVQQNKIYSYFRIYNISNHGFMQGKKACKEIGLTYKHTFTHQRYNSVKVRLKNKLKQENAAFPR